MPQKSAPELFAVVHYLHRLSTEGKRGAKMALESCPKCHFIMLEGVLMTIEEHGQNGTIYVSDLAAAVKQPLPAVSRALRQLEQDGLIERITDPNDRVISNVVLMGMGEPLQNLDAVLPALRLFLDDNAYGLSRRRVTVSTCGLVRQIDKLAASVPVALAVSLHAPDDALRVKIMPVNKKHPLADLMAACRRYLAVAPRDFITFEYLLLGGVNDADAMAYRLIDLVRDVPCKFNLIPFNAFPDSGLKAPDEDRITAFAQILNSAGIVTTVRRRRGDDIAAACGQLAGEVKDRTRRAERLVIQKEEAADFFAATKKGSER